MPAARAAPDLHLDHLRAAMGSMAEGVVLVDADSLHCLYANEAAERMLAGEARALAVPTRAWCDEAIAHSPSPFVEMREVSAHDGTRRWLEISRCAAMAGGRWLVTATIRDVTRQKAQTTRLERYRAALDQAGDAVLLVDAQRLAYVDVNDAAARMFGMSRDTLLAAGPMKLRAMAPASAPGENIRGVLRAQYAELIAASPNVSVARVDMGKLDGDVITVEATRRAFLSEGEWLIVVVMRDITDRIAAQERLELFQLAMDNSVDALTIVDRQSMRYLAANQTAVSWSGLTHEEYLSLDPHVRAWNGATRAELEAEYDQVIAISPRPRVSTVTRRRPDGSAFPTEHTRIALEMNGRWVVVSSVRDVSERMEAQRRLKMLDAAVNQAADVILVIDPQTLTYVEINEVGASMSGIPREEAMRLGPFGVTQRLGRFKRESELKAIYADVIDRHPGTVVDLSHAHTPDGRDLVLETKRRAVQVDDAWLIVSVIRDVTERHNAIQRLELFRKALDHSIDALVIIDRETMRIVDANQRSLDWSGLTREQYLAQEPHTRDGRDATRESIAAAYDEVIAISPKPHVSIDQQTRGDGTTFPAERVRTAVQLDGRWIILVSTRDITERTEAQKRLKMLDAAVNQAADAITVVDPQALTYLDVNEAAVQSTGLMREEVMRLGPLGFGKLMGLAWTESELRAIYAAVIARHPEATVDLRQGRSPDGRELVLEATRRAVRVNDTWLIVIVTRDVTDRMTGQRRLAQLEAAIDQAADSILVIDPETLGYLHINKASEQLLGISRERMGQLGVAGVIGELGMGGPEELRRTYRDLIDMHPQALTGIRKVTRPDGTTVDTESTRRAVKVEGRWLVLVVSRDVTQRLAMQERLEQLRAAVNEATDMVLVIDPQTMEFVEVNEAAARDYGLTRDAMLGMGLRRVTHFIGAWTYGQVAGHYADLIAQYPHPSTSMGSVVVEGRPNKIIESTRRAVQMEGKWLIITIGRDVTARELARRELHQRVEELARSNRDLEQFAYVTSHDLSEPLRMVASYTQLLARRYGTHFDDDGREFMGYVVTGAQRMKQLIDDLLLYSRAGKSGTELKEVSLDKALDAALANLAHVIRDSGASIERPAVLPTLACDKSGMTQVFQNLVANAIKFKGAAPPEIRIEASRGEQDWIISVADNGIGIEPQYFDRIFIIFQRLHARTEYEGTGIGLAICKRIVERHDGAMWVESTPGEGSSFKFRLPAKA